MKIKFKNVALLAVLSLATAGCQKENDVLPLAGADSRKPLIQ